MIVAAARGWIGTPYRHQMSLKGEGCDCVGLVRGVWRETVGPEPFVLPPYSPDWAEVGGREILLDGLGRWLEPVGKSAARPGDVLVFRMRDGAVAKHAAIMSAGESVDDRRAQAVHAYWGHAVVESWLGPYWRRRLAGAFRFPAGFRPVSGHDGVGPRERGE